MLTKSGCPEGVDEEDLDAELAMLEEDMFGEEEALGLEEATSTKNSSSALNNFPAAPPLSVNANSAELGTVFKPTAQQDSAIGS